MKPFELQASPGSDMAWFHAGSFDTRGAAEIKADQMKALGFRTRVITFTVSQ